MNLFKNYLYYIKLSIISVIISLIVLNLSLLFYEQKKALVITLVILFFFNFFKLNDFYKFKKKNYFFIYFLLTKIFTRIVEYYLFFFILSYINYNNASWIITISFSHILKFFFLEIFRILTKENS